MKNGSLEQIISDMVRRLDAIHADDHKTMPDDPLSGIEAFMPVDPVLASLHKDYLDANQRHKKLLHENGRDDAMAEVAADMLDSARSALQTRLIELQQSREEEINEALAGRLRAHRAKQEAAAAQAQIEARNRDSEGDTFFWTAVFYWLAERTLAATRKRLSAANDFALVSAAYKQRTAQS